MSNFQALNKTKKYFEGWYFKHQMGNQIVALIPGINMNSDGEKNAFIQIISNENSYCIYYPMSDCLIASNKLFIKIGENIFSKKGIKINIQSNEIYLKGILRYGSLTPIRYPIMGLFRLLPRMECNHEIISMYHRVQGNLILNGKTLTFDDGIGYIEKDWGHSFPKSYVWLQCNSFMKEKCSIIVSVAEIPYLGMNFKGCICAIHYKGIEYRLVTYLGVKIIICNERIICLQQGKYLLIIQFNGALKTESMEGQVAEKLRGFAHKLLAPTFGEMTRTIQEQHSCQARYIFFIGKRLLFDLTSSEASLEIVE